MLALSPLDTAVSCVLSATWTSLAADVKLSMTGGSLGGGEVGRGTAVHAVGDVVLRGHAGDDALIEAGPAADQGQLDYKLARQAQFERVVALWNDFLARHPEHGQAYLERGGALFHLRRLPDALADAQKACDLGVSEGCVRAKQLGASQ